MLLYRTRPVDDQDGMEKEMKVLKGLRRYYFPAYVTPTSRATVSSRLYARSLICAVRLTLAVPENSLKYDTFPAAKRPKNSHKCDNKRGFSEFFLPRSGKNYLQDANNTEVSKILHSHLNARSLKCDRKNP